ncbi:MAG: hypothetical protein KJZ93_15720 [Caldilineaceae bacterium]|nr:hypothetical protein [Caldilineaceae bacterium]
MRDRCFVVAHRGGPLSAADHRLLAAWAADCAERVLLIFGACSTDDRPRRAIEIARAWARGEVPVGPRRRPWSMPMPPPASRRGLPAMPWRPPTWPTIPSAH